MHRNISLITRLAVAITVAALSSHGEARAQVRNLPTNPQGTLQLGESWGGPRGYAFLLPVQPATGSAYEVELDLRPDSTIPPPDEWVWHVDNSPAQIKSDLTFKWFAQASCPGDITQLQVSGPGGTLTQGLPIANPIWGYFSTQSFTVDTVRNICTDWANSNKCDIAEPGCPLIEHFDLVGGMPPTSPADRLRLKASCSGSGPLPTLDYGAKVRLRCNRGV